MTLLFGREIRLTIQKSTGFFSQSPNNQIRITAHRVVAQVQKSLTSSTNTATITVYNLSEEDRSALQEKPLHVILEAGFRGQLSVVFRGDVKFVRSTHRTPDFETVLTLGDGHRAINFASVSRSFPPGVSFNTVLGEVAGSMGLSVPKNVNVSQIFPGGYALDGPSRSHLSKILKTHGLSWSVQNGQLTILGDREVKDNEAVIVRSPPDGDLIASPEYGDPPRDGGKPTLTFQCLLRTQIDPGVKVKLFSRLINGLFKVETVRHDLDTHGQNWNTNVEAKPL